FTPVAPSCSPGPPRTHPAAIVWIDTLSSSDVRPGRPVSPRRSVLYAEELRAPMIVAFGNPVYDYIKTPHITTGERVLSGGSTNSCLALTRLGRSTALVGRVGDDYAARFVDDARR